MMLGHWTELPGSSEASRIALLEKHLPAVQEIWIQFLDQEVPWRQSSSFYGNLQARIVEWVTIPFSRWFPFPTKRLHPVILHCWQILYHLSHQRSLWSVLGFSREWKQIGHKEGEREITEDRGRERDTTLLWLTLSWFTDFVFYTNWRLVANLPQVSYLAPFPNIICLVYVSVSHFGDYAIFKTFYY